jgi:outer membrane cobalamin receptor
VITTAQLLATRPSTVFEGLLDTPAFAGSRGGTANPSGNGANSAQVSALNLRGLGPVRTLVLYDGHRVPPTEQDGFVDANVIPQMLLQRVDVVTGGASAVYGSDAIGGVVNFITDKKFNGFKMNVEGGETKYHDDKNGTLQAAWGKGFMEDRLHVTVSGEFTKENGIDSPGFGQVGAGGRDWYDNPALQESTKALQAAGAPRYSTCSTPSTA